ncbi:MAG: helix-turn-helix domain-containing protein [Prevotella sp.]|nr:helix-turn-helix domain-containing protein [Prevotella sp.]
MSYISMHDGLPSNSITDIFEDSYGFMWIASDVGGLVRYDGYTFLHLGLGRLRSYSCRNLCEDRFGRLWIAFDEGVNVLDLKTMTTVENFQFPTPTTQHPTPQPPPLGRAGVGSKRPTPNTVMGQPARRVFLDAKGCIWIITDKQVCRLAFNDNGSISSLLTHNYNVRAFDIAIADVEENGRPWVAIDGSIYRLTASPLPPLGRAGVGSGAGSGELYLERQEVSRPLTTEIAGNFITCITRQGNTVWFGTNVGLVGYNMTSRKTLRLEHGNTPASLSHQYITCLLPEDQQLLVGTLGGIDVIQNAHMLLSDSGKFDADALSSIAITHWNATDKSNPLSSNFVHCLWSSHGILWVGTDNAGICKLFPRYLTLRNYQHNPSQLESLSQGCVNAIYADDDGTLWVGTVEGGLNRKAPGTDAFSHFTTANTSLRHNSVSAIEPGDDNDLWIGTWGGGVFHADRSQHPSPNTQHPSSNTHHPISITPIEVQPQYRYIINYVGALAYDRLNRGLWIATNGGIYFYNLQTRLIEEPFDGCRDVRGCIGSIITTDNHLWIGCLDGLRDINLNRGERKEERGEKKFQVQSSKFTVRALSHKLDNPESTITDKITCFCQTADGTLWLGSNGYGLYRRVVDENGKETFKNYTTEDGLCNNAVRGIVEDNEGRLWITTTNGLSMVDPRRSPPEGGVDALAFLNFTESDGLSSAQFYWNAAAAGKDGQIYLGAVNGLSVLQGVNSVEGDLQSPLPPKGRAGVGSGAYGRLSFTRLLVANQEVTVPSKYLDQDISHARCIRLHESDKSFTIQFAALNYTGPAQALYSYRLRGFDKRWVQLETGRHEVRYTNLPAGHYTLEVKYVSAMTNADTTASIDIIVAPYFWKSWWFVLLVLAALAALAVYAYNRRVETLRRRDAQRLMQPIEQVLRESHDPMQLQQRIENILNNQRRYTQSSAKSVEADAEQQQRLTVPFMERVMTIIEQNYMNSEFGVPEFCEKMGMSRSLLARRLNEEVGQSTTQFIRNYRLDIARQILSRADQRNIAEVAFSVGFNDPKYFTRCFTKQYGVSPKSYDAKTPPPQPQTQNAASADEESAEP